MNSTKGFTSGDNPHQVFHVFRCWQGEVKADFSHDFLGVMTRIKYFSMMSSPDYEKARFIQSSYPPFDEEYFEWIDLLEAVIEARNCFTMIELGAGWGRWLCRAVATLRQYNIEMPYHLIGVEAEPTHFQWMIEHLTDNKVDLARCRLIEAAVNKKDGTCRFWVGDAYKSYGQRIASLLDRDNRIKKVKAVSLPTLLKDLETVDLIDLDVQGEELIVLAAARKQLHNKVKRVHIGTHSAKVEKGLRKLFNKMGWHSKYDFPCGQEVMTEYGLISFQDGVQSWINPKLSRQPSDV